tara:strand:- start:1762 stop:2061 length:300 start_codon:yes stop_codon:yes gene_type:complete
MLQLFLDGGVLFMSLLSILLFMVCFAFNTHSDKLKTYGNVAVTTGILGSLFSLRSAFDVILKMGSISPAILSSGLKIALISTMYGLLIYIISRILSLFR